MPQVLATDEATVVTIVVLQEVGTGPPREDSVPPEEATRDLMDLSTATNRSLISNRPMPASKERLSRKNSSSFTLTREVIVAALGELARPMGRRMARHQGEK